jgi:hypothetical protein
MIKQWFVCITVLINMLIGYVQATAPKFYRQYALEIGKPLAWYNGRGNTPDGIPIQESMANLEDIATYLKEVVSTDGKNPWEMTGLKRRGKNVPSCPLLAMANGRYKLTRPFWELPEGTVLNNSNLNFIILFNSLYQAVNSNDQNPLLPRDDKEGMRDIIKKQIEILVGFIDEEGNYPEQQQTKQARRNHLTDDAIKWGVDTPILQFLQDQVQDDKSQKRETDTPKLVNWTQSSDPNNLKILLITNPKTDELSRLVSKYKNNVDVIILSGKLDSHIPKDESSSFLEKINALRSITEQATAKLPGIPLVYIPPSADLQNWAHINIQEYEQFHENRASNLGSNLYRDYPVYVLIPRDIAPIRDIKREHINPSKRLQTVQAIQIKGRVICNLCSTSTYKKSLAHNMSQISSQLGTFPTLIAVSPDINLDTAIEKGRSIFKEIMQSDLPHLELIMLLGNTAAENLLKLKEEPHKIVPLYSFRHLTRDNHLVVTTEWTFEREHYGFPLSRKISREGVKLIAAGPECLPYLFSS